jgi:glycosyltransferase involved in cell wall biosynthesis
MKITTDCRYINASGIGRYIQNIVSRIIKEDEFNFNLIVQEKDINKFGFLKHSNVNLIIDDSKMYSVQEQINIPLKVPKSDIFWHPHYNIPILPINAQHIVVTIHDMYHMVNIREFNLIQQIYIKNVMKNAVRKANKIITISNFSKQEIIKYTGVSSKKIKVIYPAVDTAQFKALEDKEFLYEKILQKYNISKRFILYVGNVKPHKNVVGLLNAYAIAKKYLPNDLKLVIAGESENFISKITNISKIISDLSMSSDVIFTGYIEDADLPVLYNLAEFFVFPSLYEGFGLPPLEAMACGCPVIASSVASISEACGDAVLYCYPYNTDGITQKIVQLAKDDNLKSTLRKKGLEKVKIFSWDKAAEEHIKLFKEIMDKGGKPLL